MSKFLLEQLDNKFNELEEKKTVLLGQEEEEEETQDEANVTGNLDGGAGPPKTPYAFAKSEDDMDDEHIEVLGYKKTAKSNKNIRKMESVEDKLEKKLESLIEASYRDYKKDESMKAHQKVNNSIKEINRLMWEITKIVGQNTKLKTEMGVTNEKYWKSTTRRFGKISERMLKVARQLRELSS
tara:strand:- start:43 stop:591 length:549 start_codon:yes stop_codon:yes gene_type:complete